MKKVYIKNIKFVLAVVLLLSTLPLDCFRSKTGCKLTSALVGIYASLIYKSFQKFNFSNNQDTVLESVLFGLGVGLWTQTIYKSYLRYYQVNKILKNVEFELSKLNKNLMSAIQKENILSSLEDFYFKLDVSHKNLTDNYSLITVSNYLLNLKHSLIKMLSLLDLKANNLYEPSNKDIYNRWKSQIDNIIKLLEYTNLAIESLHLSEKYQKQRENYYKLVKVKEWENNIKELKIQARELEEKIIDLI